MKKLAHISISHRWCRTLSARAMLTKYHQTKKYIPSFVLFANRHQNITFPTCSIGAAQEASNLLRMATASSLESPQNSRSGLKPPQTAGRRGSPHRPQRLSGVRCGHRTPAGLPFGKPGMGELMDMTMQHAPQPRLHSINESDVWLTAYFFALDIALMSAAAAAMYWSAVRDFLTALISRRKLSSWQK